jgi:putative ABC transport system permease protein
MDTLLQDLRIALRSLMRRPGFTAGAVLTLALGIGAATSIFSVVNGVLLRPLPYPDPDRIVRIWWHDVAAPPVAPAAGVTSPASLGDWQERTRSFAAIAQYSGASLGILSGESAEQLPAAIVTPDFFRVLGMEPIVGRTFTDDENAQGGPRAAVISHAFWQERYGGRADVLSESVTLASGSVWPIVGVAPPGLDFPPGATMWLPVRPATGCGRGCVYLDAIARLAPAVTPGQASTELRTVAADLAEAYPDPHRGSTLALASLQDVTVGSVRTALLVLLGAVMLVVLIACANVANLLLVRGAARRGELAVRAALGAGRGRLVRQILTESVALALLGGVAGVLLAYWGTSLLPMLAADSLPRVAEIGLDGGVLAFALGLVLVTALVFGIAPALHLSRAPLAQGIRQGGRSGGQGSLQRAGRFALLTAEVGLSLMLLLGAGLLLRSFERLNSADLGYDAEGLVHFDVALPLSRYPEPEDAVRFFADFRERLAALPGVRQATFVSGLPLDASVYATSFTRTDQPPPEPGQSSVMLMRFIDTDYLATMRIPVVRGRGFEEGDRRGNMPVALISRAAAEQFWPDTDPIGRSIQVSVSVGWPEDEPRTIVGIVEDVRSENVRELAAAELYLPHAQTGEAAVTMVLRSALPAATLLAAARTELHARDPLLTTIRPGTLRGLVNAQLDDSRFYMVLLSLFALLAVALAAVGVYSVVAYLVTRRTREIGVRMALGAQAGSVIRSVVLQGLGPALAGVVLGVAGAAAGTRVLASLLYETAPQDPLTYAGAAALLLTVVVLACAVPARRAAAIPPSVALREE